MKKKDAKAAGLAYRDAIKNLSLYVRLAPNDVDAMEKLGLMTANVAHDNPSRVCAFGVLEQVLRMDPERRKVRLELVRVAIAIQRYQDAKMHLEELLKASPQDADLSFLMGQCHLGKREFELAAGSFRKVIDLKPDRTEAYVLLAAVLGTFQSHPQDCGSGSTSWCRGIRRVGRRMIAGPYTS